MSTAAIPRKINPTFSSPNSRKSSEIMISNTITATPIKRFRSKRHFSNVDQEMKQQSYSKLETLKSTSHSPKTLPYPERDFQLQLLIHSNWGHNNLITCSEIDILGPDRVPIPNVQISYESTIQSNSSLELLSNKHLIKNSLKDQWNLPWNFHLLPSLSIIFSFSSISPPEYIRIWNSKLEPTANIKKISIYIQGIFIVSSEIPIDFGSVISLNSKILSQLPCLEDVLFFRSMPTSKNPVDSYGIIPVYSTKTIYIQFLDTYINNSLKFGLNAIEIFSTDGQSIPKKDILTLEILNGNNYSSPFLLFKNNRRTMLLNDMWICEQNPFNATLMITLKEKTKIIMIRIWNFNYGDRKENLSVKKLKIYFDHNHMVWNGIINRAKGYTSKIKDGITDLWLCDPNNWKLCDSINEINSQREED